MATVISLAPAPMTLPTAAMAEPPQVAVPAEMSALVFGRILSTCPSHQPSASTVTIVSAAKPAPCAPALSTIGRSIPNPSRTTQVWRSRAEAALQMAENGFSTLKARTAPRVSAIGGEAHGVRQKAAEPMKSNRRTDKGKAPRDEFSISKMFGKGGSMRWSNERAHRAHSPNDNKPAQASKNTAPQLNANQIPTPMIWLPAM